MEINKDILNWSLNLDQLKSTDLQQDLYVWQSDVRWCVKIDVCLCWHPAGTGRKGGEAQESANGIICAKAQRWYNSV